LNLGNPTDPLTCMSEKFGRGSEFAVQSFPSRKYGSLLRQSSALAGRQT